MRGHHFVHVWNPSCSHVFLTSQPFRPFSCHLHLTSAESWGTEHSAHLIRKSQSQDSKRIQRFPGPAPEPLNHSALKLLGQRKNSTLYPSTLRVVCMGLPHTHVLRNKNLIRHSYSTLYPAIFFSIYSSLVHIKDKMMIMSHKIDFMSHWSRLHFENVVPTVLPVWHGTCCLSAPWKELW